MPAVCSTSGVTGSRIVPLAPRPPFRPLPSDGIADGDTASDAVGDSRADGEADAEADADKLRRDLGAGDRYLVYPGRYDARHDVRSLFDALAMVAAGSRPAGLPPEIAWPLRVLVVGATPDDRAALARAAAGHGVGELLAYVPAVGPAVTAALVRHARAVILPGHLGRGGSDRRRVDLVRDAGRGVSRRRTPRGRRRGRPSGRTAGRRAPCRRLDRDLGG